MDIKDVKENKQSLAENLKVLLQDFEQLNGVKIGIICINRRFGMTDVKGSISEVKVDVEI